MRIARRSQCAQAPGLRPLSHHHLWSGPGGRSDDGCLSDLHRRQHLLSHRAAMAVRDLRLSLVIRTARRRVGSGLASVPWYTTALRSTMYSSPFASWPKLLIASRVESNTLVAQLPLLCCVAPQIVPEQ